jgi:tetratricopeptide (TPR) repeat protein
MAKKPEGAPPYRFGCGVTARSVEEAQYIVTTRWKDAGADLAREGFIRWLGEGLGMDRAAERLRAASGMSAPRRAALFLSATDYYDADRIEVIRREIAAYEKRAKWDKLKARGDERFLRGDYDGAADDYSDALSARETAELWNNLGAARLKGGDARLAAEHFERAAALDPNHGRGAVRLNLVEALTILGRTDEAARLLARIETEDGADESETAYRRGRIAEELGRSAEAAEWYGKAVSGGGAVRAEAAARLSECLFAAREYGKAAEALTAMPEAGAEHLVMLAKCLRYAKSLAPADEAVTKALSLSPADPAALLEKARIAKRRGRDETYKRYLTECVDALKARYR